MAKDAYYFSHDSNARHDPKITAMRGVYGSEGYGWYWMLIEMMRESEGYKLDVQSKYTFHAFALQLQADSKRLEQFVHDCIHEFDLFSTDESCVWSESLMRRMEIRDQKSEVRRKAAKARWDKGKKDSDDTDDDAKVMQMHSKSNANGMQGKESKVKENKVKEIEKEINKEDEEEDACARVFHFYQSNIGVMSPYYADQLDNWLKDMEPEAIILAIQNALDHNARNWKYINSTLTGWFNTGARTVEQCKAAMLEFESNKAKNKQTQGQQRFNSGQAKKPSIDIIQDTPKQTITAEELEEMRKMARKLDGKED